MKLRTAFKEILTIKRILKTLKLYAMISENSRTQRLIILRKTELSNQNILKKDNDWLILTFQKKGHSL